LKDFKILFGGRINANIGVDEKGLTLFNCYICPTSKSNMDSLEGILDLLKDYAMTLKSEGGIGFCANFLRPENTIINGVGVTTPGVCKFLEIFDKTSEVITSGSVSKETAKQGVPTKNSIRKGATMVTLDIRHPDIESFITTKSSPNRLNKMNMSVLVTDEFIKAVENDLD
jgi:ribonucleoside-diphosphate reductase alpha chain